METFLAKEFTPLNYDHIRACAQAANDEPLLRMVMNKLANDIIKGGVQIRIGGKYLSGPNAAVANKIWTRFCKELLLAKWTYGFAVCRVVTDPSLGKIPIVMDLESVNVRLRMDVNGRRDWMVLPAAHYRVGNTGQQDRPLSNIVVFTSHGEGPNRVGNLNSRVFKLGPAIYYYYQMRSIKGLASANRADPVIYLQREKPVHDPDDLPMGMTLPAITPGNQESADAAQRITLQESVLRQRALQVAKQQTLIYAGKLNPEALARQQQTQGRLKPLPMGQLIGRQPDAEDLTELPEARRDLVHLIGGAFDVPVSMFTPITKESGTADQNAKLVYDNTLQSVKSDVTPDLETMYYEIFLPEYAKKVIASHREAGEVNALALAQATEVVITLPGVPSLDVVQPLFMMGALKYEAFTRITCGLTGLDLSDFHKECQLSLEDLNGVKSEGSEGKEKGVELGGASVVERTEETKSHSATGGVSVKRVRETTRQDAAKLGAQPPQNEDKPAKKKKKKADESIPKTKSMKIKK